MKSNKVGLLGFLPPLRDHICAYNNLPGLLALVNRELHEDFGVEARLRTIHKNQSFNHSILLYHFKWKYQSRPVTQ